jgi:subtilase family serine protease
MLHTLKLCLEKEHERMKGMLIAMVFVFALCAPVGSNMLVLGTKVASVAPTGWTAHPMMYMRQLLASSPSGLSPSQIRSAYNLPSTGGSGTIAIVDAYDDPTAQNDLNVFSSQFGLPTPNFEKHKMSSGIPTNGRWALEISLDVQWAHAIAPNAKILLVEATSNGDTDLLAAVDYARSRSDVVAVSMSWGGAEWSSESSYDSYFTSTYGAVFFASSGDSGAGVSWPAVSANVIGVGGTKLTFSGSGVSSETAWSGSGGGVSAYVSEPSYQVNYGVPGANGKRAVPDVSYDADLSSGVSVYDSTPYSGSSGWWVVGGTSAGAPQWAAIQSLGLTTSNKNFYQDAKSGSYSSYFRDITSGSNGYHAKVGYDLVTGLGSPLTINFGPRVKSFSVSPNPFSPNSDGSKDTTTIKATFNVAVNWNLQIRNSSSAVLRTWTGTGSNLSLVWDGKNSTGFKVPDGTYTARLSGADLSGVTFTPKSVTVAVDTKRPTVTGVSVYPVSFKPAIGQTTRINYTLSESCYVTIKIYNSTGALKRTLLNSVLQTSGFHSVVWNGKTDSALTVPPGTYTIKIYVVDKAGNKAATYPIIKTVTVL